jgi:NAD(P)-dependent dehydrogenase (short-subunit alcohol dehydrogenase family)
MDPSAVAASRAPLGGRFGGKVALVVGAGSTEGADLAAPGVGAAISLLLAREGARVAVLGLGAEGAARTVDLIMGEGGEAFPLQADVSVQEDCRRAVAAVVARYSRLDILVNNLGIRLSGSGVVEVPEEEWDRVMDVNVKGLMLMTKHAVPHMTAGGAIVNMSSIGATRPTYTSSIAYLASKGAVDALTIGLAVQLAPDIRVNGVNPGNLWTPLAMSEVIKRKVDDLETARYKRRMLTPLQSEGNAWDVAYATAFLASEEARWITGHTLTVDGGATLPAPASVRRQK